MGSWPETSGGSTGRECVYRRPEIRAGSSTEMECRQTARDQGRKQHRYGVWTVGQRPVQQAARAWSGKTRPETSAGWPNGAGNSAGMERAQVGRDHHRDQRRMAQSYVWRGGGTKNLLPFTFLCALVVCVRSKTQIQTCGECTFWKDADGVLSRTGSCEDDCTSLYLTKGIVSIANGTFDGMST